MLRDKTVFLFGTAGFGGSSEYFKQILDRVKVHLDGSVLVAGEFMCQGKMQDSVLEQYQKMLLDGTETAHVNAMIDNFYKAASHPDLSDDKMLKTALSKIEKHIIKEWLI